MKIYLKDLFDFFNIDKKPVFLDTSVYTKNDKDSFLMLMTEHTFEKTLVSNITSESVFINVPEDTINT